MKVNNKIIAVTGGGSGIGRELVLQLVQKGARVAAIDINPDGLAETRSLAGEGKGRISLHRVDVADQEAVKALPEQIKSEHGAVDGLVNNAGIIQPFVSINELDDAIIEKVLKINLYGQIYLTKAFLPHLLARDEAHIVNVSSMGGFFPFRGQTLYGASKAAVKLFTEGLFLELQGTRVKATVVFPGAIDTSITQNSNVGLDLTRAREKVPFKPLSPQKAARQIISAMEKNKFQAFIGIDAKAMDFLYRIAPLWAAKIMNRIMDAVIPA